MTVRALSVVPGDTREYELAVDVVAILVGDDGPIGVERRYEALPRQNDTVAGDALDTNDRLVGDAAAVHVHTKFYELESGWAEDAPDASAEEGPDPARAIESGTFRRDRHDTWEPGDPTLLTDGASFAAACRDHFEGTTAATYERGTEAL